MDTRKVTLVATIAVIALLAVGIGYAYTASTTNSGNSADPEYINLMQSGEGKYKFANNVDIYWDSEDTGPVDTTKHATKFTLSNTAVYNDPIAGYTVVQVGKTITLNTNATNVSQDSITATLTVSEGTFSAPFVDQTAPNSNDAAIFVVTTTTDSESNPAVTYFKVTAANTFKKLVNSDYTGDNTFAIYKSGNDFNPVTVDVYFGYKGETGMYYTADLETPITGPSTSPIQSATLKFTVANEHGNAGYEYGITLTSETIDLTSAASGSTTVGYNGISSGFTVTNNNSEKITFTVEGNTITVNKVDLATGSATLTVQSVEGGFQKTITVNLS